MKTARARDVISDAMLELLASTAPYQKALREKEQSILAERTSLIGSLRQLEVEAERETPKLIADAERATADMQKAEAALRAAQQRLGNALMAKHEFGVAFGRRHDQIEAELRASASPLITAFVAEMNRAWDATRRSPLNAETAESAEKNPATGRKTQYLRPMPGLSRRG